MSHLQLYADKAMPAYFAVFGVCVCVIPRFAPILLICLPFLLFAARSTETKLALSKLEPTLLNCCIVVTLAYLAANALWSPDVPAALIKAIAVAWMVSSGVLILVCLDTWKDRQVKYLSRSFVISYVVGITVILAILLSSQQARVFFHTWFPYITGDTTKDVLVSGDSILSVKDHRLNRNVANAVIFLFPVLALTVSLPSRKYRPLVCTSILALVVTLTFLSVSETAKLALIVALLVYALTYVLSCPAVRNLLAAGWVVALLFAVPLSALPYDMGWHEHDSKWLPKYSVATRFYIWKYTAEKTMDNPLLGVGMRGTREVQKRLKKSLEQKQEGSFRKHPGRHAHNAYLQAWFELGALGVLGLLLGGLFSLVLIGKWPIEKQRAGLALFATIATISGTGWGLWQTWLLTSFILAWPLLSMAYQIREK